jgi:tRNA A37 threonylcarbamoyladenosine dehydratase
MFSYAQAFDRNIGWVTEPEQQLLRAKRIAIAGLGGVGGAHLLTLARLGIGGFHLADFDHSSCTTSTARSARMSDRSAVRRST